MTRLRGWLCDLFQALVFIAILVAVGTGVWGFAGFIKEVLR